METGLAGLCQPDSQIRKNVNNGALTIQESYTGINLIGQLPLPL
jgi:hypothetical protein